MQLCVIDHDLTAPPGSPSDGDRYIVAASTTGAWAGKDGQIVAWQDNVWIFHAPLEGWLAWVSDEDKLVDWDGSAWVDASAISSVNPTPLVGVNATADATNRLSVSSPASLFNHEGSGRQVKINNNTAPNTASVLFQTNWSGQAEFGTTGDDDFHVKVSADDSAWTEAMVVNKSNGHVGFGTNAPQAAVHCIADSSGKAFLMTGNGADGAGGDPTNGADIVLSHNLPGNRQFILADSESHKGVRFIGNYIDGVSSFQGTRYLYLGTDTHGFQIYKQLDIAGPVIATGYIRPVSYTVATLPNAASAGTGAMIYVSDENGGAVMAFSDGTNWRRVMDRVLVS